MVFTTLEEKIATGAAVTRADAQSVLECADLVQVGMLGEGARVAKHGSRVTYGRVLTMVEGNIPAPGAEFGELRVMGVPASVADARAWVRAAKPAAAGVPLTGFSLRDLLALAGGDHLALADIARMLKADGLDAVAEVALDTVGDTENTVEVIRAVMHGGLGCDRATVERAAIADRIDLVERAALVQRETGALRAFAPLPRLDPVDVPSTGYDDVKTVAIARLLCASIDSIQVDWPLYGPKLAQVALTVGADDVDGIAAVDPGVLGKRRSPIEEIKGNIRAAALEAAERDGRFRLLA
jgi:aminodeoxyfutalosine synthase